MHTIVYGDIENNAIVYKKTLESLGNRVINDRNCDKIVFLGDILYIPYIAEDKGKVINDTVYQLKNLMLMMFMYIDCVEYNVETLKYKLLDIYCENDYRAFGDEDRSKVLERRPVCCEKYGESDSGMFRKVYFIIGNRDLDYLRMLLKCLCDQTEKSWCKVINGNFVFHHEWMYKKTKEFVDFELSMSDVNVIVKYFSLCNIYVICDKKIYIHNYMNANFIPKNSYGCVIAGHNKCVRVKRTYKQLWKNTMPCVIIDYTAFSEISNEPCAVIDNETYYVTVMTMHYECA